MLSRIVLFLALTVITTNALVILDAIPQPTHQAKATLQMHVFSPSGEITTLETTADNNWKYLDDVDVECYGDCDNLVLQGAWLARKSVGTCHLASSTIGNVYEYSNNGRSHSEPDHIPTYERLTQICCGQHCSREQPLGWTTRNELMDLRSEAEELVGLFRHFRAYLSGW